MVPLHPAWLCHSSPRTTLRLAAVSVGAAPNLWLYFMDRRYIKRSTKGLQWGLEPQGFTTGSVEHSCPTLHFQPVQDKPHGPFWWSLWKSCKMHTVTVSLLGPHTCEELPLTCGRVSAAEEILTCGATTNLGSRTISNMPSVYPWWKSRLHSGFLLWIFTCSVKCWARTLFF